VSPQAANASFNFQRLYSGDEVRRVIFAISLVFISADTQASSLGELVGRAAKNSWQYVATRLMNLGRPVLVRSELGSTAILISCRVVGVCCSWAAAPFAVQTATSNSTVTVVFREGLKVSSRIEYDAVIVEQPDTGRCQ
jgi:hypothetical protein